uniref:ATPase H+ transporting accessory protein 1b n=1 Tax=Cyprinodon variegatus TaxID=28743 RepID=A0A3Q2DR27_CYPVA
SPLAGHIVSMKELSAALSPTFGSPSQTVLLFLQDKLSKDDFTRFGGVFGNKQEGVFRNLEAALQSSSSSRIFPAVEWTGESAIPALLQEKLSASPLLVDADTLEKLNLNTSVNNLLLINLPYCSNSPETCKKILSNNDEIIGKVQSFLKAKGVSYTAIYTGLQPSQVRSQSLGRSLLQTPGVNVSQMPITFNDSVGYCIMLWAQKLEIRAPDKPEWIDLATQNYTTTNVESLIGSIWCLNKLSDFTLSQRFYPVSARNWTTLDSVQLEVRSLRQTFSYVGKRGIYSPVEYSFHCQSVTSFVDALLIPDNQSTTQWLLNFNDFQVPPFSCCLKSQVLRLRSHKSL